MPTAEQMLIGISEQMLEIAKEFESCRPAFIALGDENRQRIVLVLLGSYHGMRVGEITEKVSLSRPAVSHHLKILKDASIINMYKRGTMNFYHMDAGESQWGALALLMNHANELISKISRLQEAGIECDVLVGDE